MIPIVIPYVLDGGGGPVAPAKQKGINFYDYDGTRVASWTLAELAGKTALPDNPSHDGLTAQGWNWTLARLKTRNAPTDVGQMYITDDGKTRLYLHIATRGRMKPTLYFSQTVANGVVVDWGDGGATDTLDDTGCVSVTHTYAEPGDYVIALNPAEGCELGLGWGQDGYCLMGYWWEGGPVNAYLNMLRKVEIGHGLTSIGDYAFSVCYSLSSITLPDGLTSIGDYAFSYCYSLSSITLPDGLTSIGDYAFYNCYSLSSITLPDGLESIGGFVFSNCKGFGEIHFLSSAPPTVGSSWTFNTLPTDCIIYVPTGTLAAYQAATNYPNPATYTYVEE